MKLIEPNPHHLHSLEVVIRMTGSSRRKIIFYCRKGVIQPANSEKDEWHFNEEAILRLRHIETLRQQHRMNWAAIHTIIGLIDEIETLRDELRFRR
ncbi:MAG: MerR family transcriptional regulator [Verrucomicrobiota bacterium]